MALPLLTYPGANYTAKSGLRELFWFGRSSCRPKKDKLESLDCDYNDWVYPEGWEKRLREYIMA